VAGLPAEVLLEGAAVLVLLVILAAAVWRRRGQADPPSWMGRLQTASAPLSVTLGFLLLGVLPADIITSIAVGAHVAAHGGPWWHTSVFVILTLVLLAMPALLTAAMGERAAEILPASSSGTWCPGRTALVPPRDRCHRRCRRCRT